MWGGQIHLDRIDSTERLSTGRENTTKGDDLKRGTEPQRRLTT